MISLTGSISRIGRRVFVLGRIGLGLFSMFRDTLEAALFPGRKGAKSLVKQIVNQILFTGVEAFPLVSLIGLLSGITVVTQAMTNMPKLGVGEYFGNILNIVVVRELGPFFTALVVIGRSGAALAAFIGNMRVTREVDALKVMGIDPIHFVVLPAFWGMLICNLCLSVYFALVAICGGLSVAFLMGVMGNIPFTMFFGKVLVALTLPDLGVAIFKSLMFGMIVSVVACFYGMNVKTVREVPQAIIKSVVVSMGAMIAVNVVVTITTVVLYAR
jgi:phospholipid/cholesterol/gamma-HCH transport system permease protein